jgi:DNA modification methylase
MSIETMHNNYKVLIGDCRDTLKTLPEQSVNTCVTSPPYFGLRDYGHKAQMGAEPTPDEFVAALVEVFREVRRVLRDDGTVWLNLGDSYARAGGWSNNNGLDGVSRQGSKRPKSNISYTGCKSQKLAQGLKPKDLIGIPWRVAFALQADGWYLRQDIIWHKPNPMPESATDRCTKSHEYIFLLSKFQKYYYDYEAVKEPAVGGQTGNATKFKRSDSKRAQTIPGQAYGTHRDDRPDISYNADLRNRRSVWTVPTKPYKGAHFATFPPALIEPCILAGCPESGTVLDPFGGSGTTAGVAVGNGRNAVICELNPEYAGLITERVASVSGSFVDRIEAEKQIDIFAEPVQ